MFTWEKNEIAHSPIYFSATTPLLESLLSSFDNQPLSYWAFQEMFIWTMLNSFFALLLIPSCIHYQSDSKETSKRSFIFSLLANAWQYSSQFFLIDSSEKDKSGQSSNKNFNKYKYLRKFIFYLNHTYMLYNHNYGSIYNYGIKKPNFLISLRNFGF